RQLSTFSLHVALPISGIRWVRLFYLYPEKLGDDLLELLGGHPRVLPYVDMPLQHAADGMLKRMRRGHGGARLRELVERMRSKVPDRKSTRLNSSHVKI